LATSATSLPLGDEYEMDFALSEEHQMLKDLVARFVDSRENR